MESCLLCDRSEGSDCSVSYTPPGAATAVDNVHWRAMENCSTEQKYKHDDICAQGWFAFGSFARSIL